MKDNTWRLQIDTQEMPADQEAELMKVKNKQGWFLFKETEIQAKDVPEDDAPEFDGEKSLSKRYRDVLWVFWEQKVKHTGKEYNQFRKEFMEKKIQDVKDNLD